jgi:hypothetical protein
MSEVKVNVETEIYGGRKRPMSQSPLKHRNDQGVSGYLIFVRTLIMLMNCCLQYVQLFQSS